MQDLWTQIFSLLRIQFVKKSLVGVFLSVLLSTTIWGFDVPSYTGWVNDQADVLSELEGKNLTQQIESIEAQTTAEIAILTIPTMGEIAKSDYATQTARAWGIGKDDTDNGILILVAVSDRQWFIATGYGVEGVLPDLRVQQIGTKNFPPAFRQQDYALGLTNALRDINGFLVQDESIISAYEKKSAPSSLAIAPWMYVLIHVCAVFMIGVLGFSLNQNESSAPPRNLVLQFLILGALLLIIGMGVVYFFFFIVSFFQALTGSKSVKISDDGYVPGGGWTSGGGGFGSGGFGGFGGGDFGGGGFGGDW